MTPPPLSGAESTFPAADPIQVIANAASVRITRAMETVDIPRWLVPTLRAVLKKVLAEPDDVWDEVEFKDIAPGLSIACCSDGDFVLMEGGDLGDPWNVLNCERGDLAVVIEGLPL